MATIPIEVIVQDKASPEPTPTPSDSGETNMVVPDTGAGTINNASNGGGIGSAVSIILPAIILVLSIGAIVAMLVHKHRKHTNSAMSKKEKLATVASGTIAILAATVLVGNLVIPATKAASDDVNGSAGANEGTYIETEDKVSIVATIDKDSKEPTIVTVKDILYATTDASGYTVTMSMINDAITSNLYLNGDESSEYYIASVEVEDEDESEDTTEGTELATNTWGYRLSEESDYLPVPLADTPATVAEGEEATEHEEINVYYGLKVDGALPLGTYSGEIEYDITPVNPIDKLTYMQDFAKLSVEEKTALIAAMPEGRQYILKDFRDKKPYYISKLADGNVWMTQNLDLDIDEGTTYTHTDTDLGWSGPNSLDVTAKWKPDEGHSTISFTSGTVEGWVDSNTAPYSADPGDVYYYTSGTDANDTKYNSLADCEEDHKDGSCPHYHAGNYYNWSAAVASNNTSEMAEQYQNAPDSICPAGWRLPQGKTHTDSDYYELLVATGGILGEEIPPNRGGGFYFANGGLNDIRTNPLWETRTGGIFNGGNIGKNGSDAEYLTSTVFSNNRSSRFVFDSGTLRLSNSDNRYVGSVRCMVR